jgi:hypothetical protein
VIASPNFAVKPSWGGRICDLYTLNLIFTLDLTGFPLPLLASGSLCTPLFPIVGAFFYFILFFFLHTNFDFAARCAQLCSIGRLDDLAVDVE